MEFLDPITTELEETKNNTFLPLFRLYCHMHTNIQYICNANNENQVLTISSITIGIAVLWREHQLVCMLDGIFHPASPFCKGSAKNVFIREENVVHSN